MRPLPSFEDKKKQKEKENTLLYESERRRILAEAENLKLRAAEDLRNEVVANRKKLEFEIADLYNEREKLAVVKTTEENIINELRRSISIEKEKLEYLRNSIEEYNASVIQTKIRILRNAKYEKEKELNELKDKYSKMLSETLTAIALIESRMAE